MSEFIQLPKKVVSLTAVPFVDKCPPKALRCSEDGVIAVLHTNSLSIGIIECAPKKNNTRYVFNKEEVIVDFSYEIVFNVSNFDFCHQKSDRMIFDKAIFNFNIDASNEVFLTYNSLEWSPLDVVTNKLFLAVSRFDGRIIVLGYNTTNNCWQKEFDISDLYCKFYKDTLLKCQIEDKTVHCTNFLEYTELKNDLKLIDFSWSMLVRQHKNQQYYLLALLTYSGIITIWRIVVDQLNSRPELVYHVRFSNEGIVPLNIKFCDISETSFFITIVDSRDLIKSYHFSIGNNDMLFETLLSPIIIKQQVNYCQNTKIQWSMKYGQLLVGFEWKLLIAKIIVSENNKIETESAMIFLPSRSEISGISLKNSTAYITSVDGYLFGLKLAPTYNCTELSQIMFPNPELMVNNEFVDVFISPNSVYLGFLSLSQSDINSPNSLVSNIVLVSLLSESHALNILMNDNIPFSRKQDAIEEIKHLYFNQTQGLNEALKKIGSSEVQWDSSSLNRLQFVRYICIFFGYKFDVIKELRGQIKMTDMTQITKIRKLESIIILKNISYWLDGFSELDSDEIVKDDCVFVLKVIRKLELLPKDCIPPKTEAAASKCIDILKNKFNIDDNELKKYRDSTADTDCVICGLQCNFNLFGLKCNNNHIFSRCCKSLELCSKAFKTCRTCGASESTNEIKDLSNWRLEIVNSNCPLCDGKLLNSCVNA